MRTIFYKLDACPPGPEGDCIDRIRAGGQKAFHNWVWGTYGRESGICQFTINGKRFTLVTSGNLIDEVLRHSDRFPRGESFSYFRKFLGDTVITMEGKEWAKKRMMILHRLDPRGSKNEPAILKKYEADIQAASERLVQRLEGQPRFDLLTEMTQFTVDVIGRVLLNLDLDDKIEPTKEALRFIVDFVSHNNALYSPKPSQTEISQFKRALSTLRDTLSPLIKDYFKTWEVKKERTYYMDELMAAHAEELAKDTVSKQLLDEITMVFFAGQDTTAKLLTWSLFILATQPDIEEKIVSEIKTKMGDQKPTESSLAALRYLNNFVEETLRLYPPVPATTRDTVGLTKLGPYTLKAGTTIILDLYRLHRDPSTWTNADHFNPERFFKPVLNDRLQNILVPFLLRSHRCPGMRLAQLETKMLLVYLLPRFKFVVRNADQIRPIRRLTLIPDRNIEMEAKTKCADNSFAALPLQAKL